MKKRPLLYLCLLVVGMTTMLIPVIDVLGDRTLWVKQTNFNYLLDICILICGGLTSYFAETNLTKK